MDDKMVPFEKVKKYHEFMKQAYEIVRDHYIADVFHEDADHLLVTTMNKLALGEDETIKYILDF